MLWCIFILFPIECLGNFKVVKKLLIKIKTLISIDNVCKIWKYWINKLILSQVKIKTSIWINWEGDSLLYVGYIKKDGMSVDSGLVVLNSVFKKKKKKVSLPNVSTVSQRLR